MFAQCFCQDCACCSGSERVNLCPTLLVMSSVLFFFLSILLFFLLFVLCFTWLYSLFVMPSFPPTFFLPSSLLSALFLFLTPISWHILSFLPSFSSILLITFSSNSLLYYFLAIFYSLLTFYISILPSFFLYFLLAVWFNDLQFASRTYGGPDPCKYSVPCIWTKRYKGIWSYCLTDIGCTGIRKAEGFDWCVYRAVLLWLQKQCSTFNCE
jgi:hypothetical protein